MSREEVIRIAARLVKKTKLDGAVIGRLGDSPAKIVSLNTGKNGSLSKKRSVAMVTGDDAQWEQYAKSVCERAKAKSESVIIFDAPEDLQKEITDMFEDSSYIVIEIKTAKELEEIDAKALCAGCCAILCSGLDESVLSELVKRVEKDIEEFAEDEKTAMLLTLNVIACEPLKMCKAAQADFQTYAAAIERRFVSMSARFADIKEMIELFGEGFEEAVERIGLIIFTAVTDFDTADYVAKNLCGYRPDGTGNNHWSPERILEIEQKQRILAFSKLPPITADNP